MALSLEEMLTRRPVDEKHVAAHLARMKLSLEPPMDQILDKLSTEDREAVERCLRTPDLYPARNIKEGLQNIGVQVRIPDIHAWRKARGIKKASC